jgi:glycine cleavage system transcriptional repressor
MHTQHPHAVVLHVLADDHPGIVAALCSAVSGRGGNIDSCSQTVVGGYFTLIMIASFPVDTPCDALAQEIAGPNPGLDVICRPLADSHAADPAAGRFILTVVGPDHPGIVEAVSQFCAAKKINITDLCGHRAKENFVVLAETDIPPQLDIATLQTELNALGKQLDATLRLQHENLFIATNQLRLQ